MLPPGLGSAREVTLYHNDLYNKLTSSGQALPFVYPWAGIGVFIVLGYLLIDHRKSAVLKCLRYPIFAFLCAFQAWCIVRTRARNPAAAFGVGLLSAWGVLWVGVVMIVNDCQQDFRRLEWSRGDGVAAKDSVANGNVDFNASPAKTDEARTLASNHESKDGSPTKLYWQDYPTRFQDRVDWVADVFCNFRGVGCNYQISGVPPVPEPYSLCMPDDKTVTASEGELTTSRSGVRRMSNRTALLRTTIFKLALGYLFLDVIKCLMNRDAYFWGYTIKAAPPTYLPLTVQQSPVLLKCYRLAIGMLGLYAALSQAFILGPLFFAFILGPKRIGLRGEAWMNPPDMFGSYACVLDQGLAGWWGGWWHQTFRFAFETCADKLLKALQVEKKSARGRMAALFVAFFLSGYLHAAGSYTQLGDTRPLMGPMRFFLLQPVGIMLQIYATRLMSQAGILQKTPKWLKQTGNFVYVHFWGYMTASLLIDDFASGGNFLYEPLAISPLRGLGFGAKDDGWWCWWNGLIFWRKGEHWWDTGIAI